MITRKELKNTYSDILVQTDAAIVDTLADNFYLNSQQIIETHYLLPMTKDLHHYDLPKKQKKQLKDGDIERLIHGGMHVGRAQFWSVILNQKIKEMLPNYSKTTFEGLNKALGLNEKQIMTLVRYAILFHDSARENEGEDHWDKESANNGYNFLIKQGISENLAVIFSKAAELKDKPEEFAKLLKDHGYDNDSIANLQYIRKLIYLSDCFDIMRCVGVYDLGKALQAFDDIEEFQSDTHLAAIVDVADHIHAVIEKQDDMLYHCVIELPNGEIHDLSDDLNHFNPKTKVAFEHADNVCSALGASIQDDPFFAQYLAQEDFLETSLASVKPIYNPYIHGTSSLVLPMLLRTGLCFIPAMELLDKHGLAPLCGEIDNIAKGPFETIATPVYISFARMLSKGYDVYNLDKLLRRYTDYPLPTEEDAKSTAEGYANKAVSCGFDNINKLLIHVGRGKQLGGEGLSPESYQALQKNLNGLMQFYYLLALIGTYIHPNYELYNKSCQELRDTVVETPELREQYNNLLQHQKKFNPDFNYSFEDFLNHEKKSAEIISDSVYHHLTFEKLLQKVIDSGLNIQEIYQNPTPENLSKVLSLLEFPKTSTILTGMLNNKEKTVTLEKTQFFTLEPSYPSDGQELYGQHHLNYYAINKEHYQLKGLLMKLFTNKTSQEGIQSFSNIVLQRATILKKKLETLEMIMKKDYKDEAFSPEELQLMENPFPLILICTAEEKVKLSHIGTQEYRANQSLKLGEDITMIATDTVEHQFLLMKYLEKNNVQNVEVVLISQLQKSEIEKSTPKSNFTHSDGFPRLSFYAAAQVPNEVIKKIDDEKLSSMAENVSMYQSM